MCYWTLVLYVQRSVGRYTLLEGTSPRIDSSAKMGKESILTASGAAWWDINRAEVRIQKDRDPPSLQI